MAKPLDSLISGVAQTQAPMPQLGETKRLQDLVKAAQGQQFAKGPAGQATVDTGAEEAALQQTQAQSQQQQLQQQQAALNLQQEEAKQEQAFEQNVITLDEKQINMAIEAQNKASDILTKVSQQKDKLSLARQQSALELATFQARLSNEQYVSQLQIVGKRQRLNNDLTFKREYTRTALGNKYDMFLEDVNFRTQVRALERGQRIEMAKFNIDQAIAMSKLADKEASIQAQYQAVGQGIQATAQGAEKLADAGVFDQDSTPKPIPGGQTPDTSGTITNAQGRIIQGPT